MQVRYVIFSTYDPYCQSQDCAKTYKIDNLKFFRDTGNKIAHQNFPYQGKYVFFSSSEQLIKKFLKGIPHKLLQEKDSIIGQCIDCEKVYLEIGFNDTVKYWVIDEQLDPSQPAYAKNVVEQVQTTIAQLQDY